MKSVFSLVLLAAASVAFGQDIALPAAQKTGGMPLMEALAKRSTSRSFDNRELTPQQLGDVLWAGLGINRDDGKRTSPTARNRQEIELYVLLKSGAYVYDPAGHLLKQVNSEDLRSLGAKTDAPVLILFVADLSKRTETGEARKNVAAVDSGFVSQNIYLYCASAGLATGYRGGGFDRAAIAPRLKLREDQHIVASQPVGYAKP